MAGFFDSLKNKNLGKAKHKRAAGNIIGKLHGPMEMDDDMDDEEMKAEKKRKREDVIGKMYGKKKKEMEDDE